MRRAPQSLGNQREVPGVERERRHGGRRRVLRHARRLVQGRGRKERPPVVEIQSRFGRRGRARFPSAHRTASNTSRCTPASVGDWFLLSGDVRSDDPADVGRPPTLRPILGGGTRAREASFGSSASNPPRDARRVQPVGFDPSPHPSAIPSTSPPGGNQPPAGEIKNPLPTDSVMRPDGSKVFSAMNCRRLSRRRGAWMGGTELGRRPLALRGADGSVFQSIFDGTPTRHAWRTAGLSCRPALSGRLSATYVRNPYR